MVPGETFAAKDCPRNGVTFLPEMNGDFLPFSKRAKLVCSKDPFLWEVILTFNLLERSIEVFGGYRYSSIENFLWTVDDWVGTSLRFWLDSVCWMQEGSKKIISKLASGKLIVLFYFLFLDIRQIEQLTSLHLEGCYLQHSHKTIFFFP